MRISTTYRSTLQPYTGPASRHPCPACHKPRCFTRYVDTASGTLLEEHYGRCDHEVSCGYHRRPHYAALLAAEANAVATRRRFVPPPILTIPSDVVRASEHARHYPDNALAIFLRKHFGWGVADNLLRRFRLGTSALWPGACVFWLFDEQNRARGGQVVLYDATGHTVQKPVRHTRWAHTALTQAYRQRGEPLPPWLADYAARGQKSPCLFGLPQLATASPSQPVVVVESAKTAMLATPYFPQFVWLATMGLGNLTEERLHPLKNRRVYLLPDAGAFEVWARKVPDLQARGYAVEMLNWLEKIVTPEQRATGWDLADTLVQDWPGYPPSWDDKS